MATTGQAVKRDRGDLLVELSEATERLLAQPGDAEARLTYCRLLYQAGEFPRAAEALAPVVGEARASVDALLLMAELRYLMGQYGAAERLARAASSAATDDAATRKRARSLLALVCYQTNRYLDAAELISDLPDNPLVAQMASFGADVPNVMEWGGCTETVVPFLMTDPLPVVEVEVDGRLIHALIDTGGDSLIVDIDLGAEMGIKPVAETVGTFGGGKRAPWSFARAREIRLGDSILHDAPLTLIATRRFSPVTAGRYTVEGIVGTRVLQQVLATMDYVNGELTLRDRRMSSVALDGLRARALADIPFYLTGTHHMLARGRLNDRDGLLFFVDSGLASEAAFSAPIQTLHYANIPVPETKIPEGGVGGGGGAWASGTFPIETLGLGPLLHRDLIGEYGARTPESYWQSGFIEDGLISHRFLRQYAWTIDFEGMRMVFTV